jgi:hypothetical protein
MASFASDIPGPPNQTLLPPRTSPCSPWISLSRPRPPRLSLGSPVRLRHSVSRAPPPRNRPDLSTTKRSAPAFTRSFTLSTSP